jgi:hypothetical protein
MSVNVKVRTDGTIKGSVKNASGEEMTKVTLKEDRSFSKIVKHKNYLNETVEVIHSSWTNNSYHQDQKFPKEILMGKEFCEKALKEKQDLRLTIKKVVQNNRIN